MAKRLFMYMGRVVGRNDQWKAAEIRVQEMKLDDFLVTYINEANHYWAADPDKKAKNGDMVLIKQLKYAQSDKVEYEVDKVVFPLGLIVDPVTGRRCRGTEYIDEEQRKRLLNNSSSEATQ